MQVITTTHERTEAEVTVGLGPVDIAKNAGKRASLQKQIRRHQGNEMSVPELVKAAARGDESSWAAMVDRYNGLIWAVARNHRLNSADAADVVQTTWLKLFENLGSLRDPDRVGSWLAVTARHEALRTLRRSRNQVLTAEESDLEARQVDVPGPDFGILTAERDAELRRAFGELPLRCQRLLELLLTEPRANYREIAAALDMPVGSIGPTRARCLACLRRVTNELAA
jgi:RNA polymerase sigma factor (sigma-70 family)